MQTVLVTGFGPFPGAPFNPSGVLATSLARKRRPAFAGMRLVTHVFHTSYAAVDRDLPRLLECHRPDVVVLFGLAARTRTIRIETRSRNAQSVLFADASGVVPLRRSGDGPAAVAGRAPFPALLRAARATRLPARLSIDAGKYLCNYIYGRALALASKDTAVVFVHVPKVRRQPVPITRRRTFSDADLVRAGEAIVTSLAAAQHRR